MATLEGVLQREAPRAPRAPAEALAPERLSVRQLAASAVRGLALGAFIGTASSAAALFTHYHLFGTLVDAAIGFILMCAIAALVNGLLSLVGVSLSLAVALAGRLAGRRLDRRGGRLGALRRVLGSWTLSAGLVAVFVIWLSPDDGPAAIFSNFHRFEVIVATLALCGLLIGLALAAGTRPRVALPTAGLALALGLAVASWAAWPGFGVPAPYSRALSAPQVAALGLPDPSAAGPLAVTMATYGSGTDLRRPEFGAGVTWRTQPVDAASGMPPRTDLVESYERWYWGFDGSALPLNGVAWYSSAASAPMPVVLVVHGNHSAGEASHPGYAYLGEHLASHGFFVASIDENFLNGDPVGDMGGAEQRVRAWLLLRHAAQLATWNATPGHALYGRLDMDNVALVGHSRGGEAAAVAANMLAGRLFPAGLAAIDPTFHVGAVIAIAPSTGQYSGPMTVGDRDYDYLVIQGAYDADLTGFVGLQTYHATRLDADTDRLKVALYSARSNHGRFSSVWLDGDAGVSSWMLDRGPLNSLEDQQRLAKTAITAFVERSLRGRTEYDAFFRDPVAGAAWLPDDLLLSHWQSSRRVVVTDFNGKAASDALSGAATLQRRDPRLRDGSAQGDMAGYVEWTGPARLTFAVPPETPRMDGRWSLVFGLAGGGAAGTHVDALVEVTTTDGRRATLRLSEVTPPRPVIDSYLWKLPILGERHGAGERHVTTAERFLQTYAVPLERFGLDGLVDGRAQISQIVLGFDGSGSAYLDDIGFEPPLD